MGKSMKLRLSRRVAGLGMVALLAAPGAWAELSYGLETGVGYSDNITRASSDEIDETIGALGLDLQWDAQTRRIEGSALVDLSYYEYMDETFESEVLGNANATAVLGLVPERFTWFISDAFGQAHTDPFSPGTPENREDLNFFTTGPDFIMRLGGATSVRLFGRYSVTTYEESLLDSHRRSGGVALQRDLSARSRIALNGVSERVEFDDAPSDYDRENAFLSYEFDGARTDITGETGYTWVKPRPGAGGEESGGLLASLSLVRTVSPSSTLFFDVGTNFSDAGEALRTALEGGLVGGADITATTDLFENRYASVRYRFFRHRTGFELGTSWSEDRYEERTEFDRTRFAYEASLTRQVGSNTDFVLLAILNQEEFDTNGLRSDELSIQARLDWRLGRSFGLALTIERFDRGTNRDDEIGLGREYSENRAFLMLTYRSEREPGATTIGTP
jgi:hypothetical protein